MRNTAAATALGMLFMVSILVVYYASYHFRIPVDNAVLIVGTAAFTALCGIMASIRARPAGPGSPTWAAPVAAILLLVAPGSAWRIWQQPAQANVPRAPDALTETWTVRVMTYNVHQGFDVDGHLDAAALANVIESTGADIVALQEVSRGWYINGSMDVLAWLSARLGMPYVFGEEADEIEGNAILSRYPVTRYGNGMLPRGDVVMKSGYLWAEIDLGEGESLLVITAHLYHIEEEIEVRIPQVEALLELWDGREHSIILGDMNSWPHYSDTALFRQAGLRDAFALAGTGSGFTYRSDRLDRRIDYIWITPDLEVENLAIPFSTASDHLAVGAPWGQA
jgi:endonuclease/exonuclease/phosphatase family metal-dependent hydrolase